MQLKRLVAVVLMAAGCLQAQTAKVVELSAKDAAEAKQLNEEQIALTVRQHELRDRILKTYVELPTTEERPRRGFRPGWKSSEFEFSDDFRFIVPTSSPIHGGSGTVCGTLGCGDFTRTPGQWVTTTPYYGPITPTAGPQ